VDRGGILFQRLGQTVSHGHPAKQQLDLAVTAKMIGWLAGSVWRLAAAAPGRSVVGRSS
jgi:hypothetical protein